MTDLTIGIHSQYHYIKLNREVRADLKLWQSFDQFQWAVLLSRGRLGQLCTDAAGSAVFGRKRCYGKWPNSWLHQNIAMLEFYPIVLSLHLWGHTMQNRCILFLTDNEALVYVINKHSCRDKSLMFFCEEISANLFTKQHTF